MEIVGRLNKLQSIVLNAANLDQGRAEEAVARPVSPTKMGRMDDERLSENEVSLLAANLIRSSRRAPGSAG